MPGAWGCMQLTGDDGFGMHVIADDTVRQAKDADVINVNYAVYP